MQTIFENDYYSMMLGENSALIYRPARSDASIELTWPQFEIDGAPGGASVSKGEMQM